MTQHGFGVSLVARAATSSAYRSPRGRGAQGGDLKVESVAMCIDESGGTGPIAVCLPWFGTSRVTTRDALGPAFAGRALRAVYPDLPGHGDSAALLQATSEAVLAEIIDLVEQQAQQPVLLAGCSYGGYLASAVARRRPDLVLGMLLVCPGVRRSRDLPARSVVPSDPDWLDDAPTELHDHLDRALGNRTRRTVQRVLAALHFGGPGDEAYQDELQGGDGYFFDDDDADAVFSRPVAVLTGRQDRIVGVADQFRRMSLYPRGTFTATDLAGHYLPYERPALLRALASDWLDRCCVD